MKKKTLLISGLLFLGAALGITTYAVSQASPDYATRAEGDEEVQTSLLSITSSTPNQDGTVLSTEPLAKIQIITNMSGDMGLSLLDATKKITIYRNGAVYETIDVSNKANFDVDRNYTNGFNIIPTKPISQFGSYEVVIPEGIVGGEYVDAESEAIQRKVNPAYTLRFVVTKAIEFTVTPSNGEVASSDLKNLTITYPEGATTKVTGEGKATLIMQFQGTSTQIGTYTPTAAGNAIKLALNADAVIETKTNAANVYKYYVKVDGGMWNITYDGDTAPNPAYTELGNWQARAFMPSSFQSKPANKTEQPVAAADFKQLKLQFMGDQVLEVSNPAALISLKLNTPSGTAKTILQWSKPTVSENGKILTYELTAPTSLASNDVDLLITASNYYIEIPANTFAVNGTKNAKLTLSDYNIKGIENLPFGKCSPADNSVQTSVSSFTVATYYNAVVVNQDAKLTVKRTKGSEEPTITEIPVTNTTTAAALPEGVISTGNGTTKGTGKGSGSISGYKLSAAADKETNVLYEVTIPAGAYGAVNNLEYTNKEYTVSFWLNPENPEYTVSLPQYDPNAENPNFVKEISEFTITYPEGCKLTPNNVSSPYSFGTQNVSYYNNASGVYPTDFNIAAKYDVTFEGNKINVKLTNGPVRQATGDKLMIYFKIAAGAFNIEQNGKSIGNNAVLAQFRIKDVWEPNLLYMTEVYNEETEATTLQSIAFDPTTPIDVKKITGSSISNAPNAMTLHFFQNLNVYPASLNVLDKAGEVVSALTFGKKDGVKGPDINLFFKTADAEKIPLGKAEYYIEIPAESLGFGSATTTATTYVTNNASFKIPFTLRQTEDAVEFAEVFSQGIPAAEFNINESYLADTFAPQGMGVVLLDVPAGIEIEQDSKFKAQLLSGEEVISEIPVSEISLQPKGGGGIMPFAEGEEATTPDYSEKTQQVVFHFNQTGMYDPKFCTPGKYTVKVPEGMFYFNNGTVPVAAGEFEYTLTAAPEVSYEPTSITPANNTSFEGPIPSVSIKFPENVQFIGYEDKVGNLYDPKGEVVTGFSSAGYADIDFETSTITWDFAEGSKKIDWQTGTYTFKLPKNSLYINRMNGYYTEGNWPTEDLELTYNVSMPVAFADVFTYGTPAAEFDINHSVNAEMFQPQGMGMIFIDAPEGISVVEYMDDNVPMIELYYGEELVNSVPADMTYVMPKADDGGGIMPFAEGEEATEPETPAVWQACITLNNTWSYDAKYYKPGKYTVKIPANVFTLNGNPVLAGELEYTLLETPASSFEYTVTPESGSSYANGPVPNVTFSFPDVQCIEYMDYPSVPGALYGPDGEKMTGFSSSYPSIDYDQTPLTLTWKFEEGNTPIDWKPGTYTFKLEKNSIYLNLLPDWAAEGNWPAEDIELTYTIAEPLAFDKVVTYGSPGAEFNLEQSYYRMPFGMGLISLKVAEDLAINEDCKDKVELYFGETLVTSVDVNEDNLMILSYQGAAEDEPGLEKSVSLLVNLAGTTDVTEVPDSFKQIGDYTVKFPAGAFSVNGVEVLAGELTYKLVATPVKEYTATFDPADGTEFDGPIPGVKLTMGGASTVNYSKVPGGLYNPAGEKMKFSSSYPVPSGNTLTWSFKDGVQPNVWTPGVYKFRIDKNTIYVDRDEEMYDEGNWPAEDLVITYIVKDDDSAVALIGVEPASDYTVYTVDGKVVMLKAKAEKLFELQNGMYIVNGKKTMIRK